eukprot:11277843-Heterocapsa_arctica.AAC.1
MEDSGPSPCLRPSHSVGLHHARRPHATDARPNAEDSTTCAAKRPEAWNKELGTAFQRLPSFSYSSMACGQQSSACTGL